jgi:hypothetical protein
VEATVRIRPSTAYFWATYSGAELDLLFFHRGRAFGVEAKFSEAPRTTRSMRVALADLDLSHLWLRHPGPHTDPMDDPIAAVAIRDIDRLATELG